MLLEGISGGDGVMLWLRPGDASLSGDYAPLPRGDTMTPRGAAVSVRTATRIRARGATLDSGTIAVAAAARRLDVSVDGTGADLSTAERVSLQAAFRRVPLAADTVECRPQP
jgi:hypothetical protein